MKRLNFRLATFLCAALAPLTYRLRKRNRRSVFAELDSVCDARAVHMSRGPHFSSNAKAEKELGYVPTSPFMMRWKISSREVSREELPTD